MYSPTHTRGKQPFLGDNEGSGEQDRLRQVGLLIDPDGYNIKKTNLSRISDADGLTVLDRAQLFGWSRSINPTVIPFWSA